MKHFFNRSICFPSREKEELHYVKFTSELKSGKLQFDLDQYLFEKKLLVLFDLLHASESRFDN